MTTWIISDAQRSSYIKLFKELDTNKDGLLTGNETREHLTKSKIKVDQLAKIWALSERDKDGKLNEEEFIIAQFLVDMCKKVGNIPDVLPQELIDSAKGSPVKKKKKPLKRNTTIGSDEKKMPDEVIDELNDTLDSKSSKSKHKSVTTSKKKSKWVISSSEKKTYLQKFDEKSQNGFIDGPSAVAVFSKSKLPREDLAKIWSLSDMDKDSKLSKQEFFVAMHLITKRVNKFEIPDTLPVELVYSASGIKKTTLPMNQTKNSRSSTNLILKGEHGDSLSMKSTSGRFSSSGADISSNLSQFKTMSKRSSIMFSGSLSSYGIDESAVPEYDSYADINKLESIQDLEVALAFAKQLDEDISNLTLQTEKQKLQTESLQDKLSFREEQIQMIEKRKEAFTSLLNSYSSDSKEEEAHLRDLQNEMKTLLAEIDESQKSFTSPATELQLLRDKKKKLQNEYNSIKQEYDKDKVEYQRLILEIEKVKAETPNSTLDFTIDTNWSEYDFQNDNTQFDSFSTTFEPSFDFQASDPKFDMAFESGTMTPVYSDFMEPQEEYNVGWISQSGIQTPSEPSFDSFFNEEGNNRHPLKLNRVSSTSSTGTADRKSVV